MESKEARSRQIREELDEIDRKSIRPLSAVYSGQLNEADIDKLRELEKKSQKLRYELALISHGKDGNP